MRVIECQDALSSTPVISILCITFNQRDYIRDALDSFLAQKINVPFEVLVNDDCSTDGTNKILLEYQQKHPDIFRIVLHETNQYSKGKSPMGEFLVPLARGSYIAMCEGDDYWTDSKKLARQLTVLESHPEYAACVHAHVNVQAETKHAIATIRYRERDCLISAEDITTHSQCYATNSLFVRASAMRGYHESAFFRLKADGDHKMLEYFGLIAGGIFYINETMSAYRVLAKNSANRSMLMSSNLNKIAASKRDRRIELLKLVDSATGGRYHREIARGIDSMDYAYYRDIRDLRTLRRRWPDQLKQESFLGHLDLFTFTYCKPVHTLLLWIYSRI